MASIDFPGESARASLKREEGHRIGRGVGFPGRISPGLRSGNGLVSCQFDFPGESARASLKHFRLASRWAGISRANQPGPH